jgi:hypothetical protein
MVLLDGNTKRMILHPKRQQFLLGTMAAAVSHIRL